MNKFISHRNTHNAVKNGDVLVRILCHSSSGSYNKLVSKPYTVCAVEVTVTSYKSLFRACLMTSLFVATFGLQVLILSVVRFTMSASNGRMVVEQ